MNIEQKIETAKKLLATKYNESTSVIAILIGIIQDQQNQIEMLKDQIESMGEQPNKKEDAKGSKEIIKELREWIDNQKYGADSPVVKLLKICEQQEDRLDSIELSIL